MTATPPELGDLSMEEYRKARRGEGLPPAPEPPSITNERDAAAFLSAAREQARGVLADGVDGLTPAGLLEWLGLPAIPATPDGNPDEAAIGSAVRAQADRFPSLRASGYQPDVDLGSMTMADYRHARRDPIDTTAPDAAAHVTDPSELGDLTMDQYRAARRERGA